MLHMTLTARVFSNGETTYTVFCNCGWEENGFHNRGDARKAGDDHLAKENSNE